MKLKWSLLTGFFIIVTVLTGCEPLMVLDPKGPVSKIQADIIMISVWTMAVVVVTVMVLFAVMVWKYRASKQRKDYEPPHIEGSVKLELIWTAIPIIIVAFLSVVTVKGTYGVEAIADEYEKEPLVIYATASNWKWNFSYPEEDIETVNYVFIPTNRPVEFRLYAYGPMASFWVPQLGGQKYAMEGMVNKLTLAADFPGEYSGRNASFSGEGFAEQTFNVQALSQDEYEQWVDEIKATAEPLTEKKFNELLKPGRLGQLTFTGTHLDFAPAPEGHHGQGDKSDMEDMSDMNSKEE
ncbi:cytochrome aa3 quinol oxidase subunit II [Mesobacillus sp.]|uniref:cytochrome aa3 quinol oxidase subunit II n=1 Tax=Mesobacillus sp. TaxID=2675271 RepID=UPI0039F04CBF